MKYIHQLTEQDFAWWGFHGPGWYFEDEAGYVTGPYESSEKAKEAFDQYVKEYLA